MLSGSVCVLSEEQTKKLLFPFFGFINNRVTELSKLCVLKMIRIVNGPIIVASCTCSFIYYASSMSGRQLLSIYLFTYLVPKIVFYQRELTLALTVILMPLSSLAYGVTLHVPDMRQPTNTSCLTNPCHTIYKYAYNPWAIF